MSVFLAGDNESDNSKEATGCVLDATPQKLCYICSLKYCLIRPSDEEAKNLNFLTNLHEILC